MPENQTLGFFTGDMASFNVQQTLLNMGEMLNDNFELHHITTCPDKFPDEMDKYFEVFSRDRYDGHFGAARLLKLYFREKSPDLITQVGRVPVDGNLIALCTPPGVDIVCRYSGDLFYEYNLDSGLRKVSSFLLKNIAGRFPMIRADRFISMGPRQKRRLVDRGIDPEDIGILPPPIDTERLKTEDTPSIDIDEDKIALYVGRISEKKGAKTLEQVIPEVISKRNDIHFLLVGSQHYQLDLPKIASEKVTCTGPISPDLIPQYHNISDVYIHPSLTEGISRAMLEAIASGTRVITRDVGDQSYATTNYFTTDDELRNMLIKFERLPVDSPSKFDIQEISSEYVDFYTND